MSFGELRVKRRQVVCRARTVVDSAPRLSASTPRPRSVLLVRQTIGDRFAG
jgi:hypothetical protein